jgi:hypothetical protein
MLLRSALFCIGFVLSLALVELGLWRFFSADHARRMPMRDIYQVLAENAHAPDDRVTTLYLGDSVARQLFRPGTETDPRQRYLTTNAAVSLAGQYFLLEEALASFPNVRQVNLILAPPSLGVDLHTPWTALGFYPFFHDAAEIRMIFNDSRDIDVAEHQLQYLILPERMRGNELLNGLLAPRYPPGTQDQSTRLFMARHPFGKGVADRIEMSWVSTVFLRRMRELCASRHITFRLVPAPTRSDRRFDPSNSPFEAGIWYVDASEFVDQLHFKPQFMESNRAAFVDRFHLQPVAAGKGL